MHGALGDFLPPGRREVVFIVEFELPVGLRDLVQSVGVPHVEVEAVTVDGEPSAWTRVIDDGCRIDGEARYPLAAPPARVGFLLDAHLGRLAGYLRLLGLDASDDPAADDPELVERSVAEERILLTRDKALLRHGGLRDGTFVRAVDPVQQASEVVDRFALRAILGPFTRCMACNTLLEAISSSRAAPHVPASVIQRHDRYMRCPGCNRVYWEGSHHRRLTALVERIVGPA
jgi:uncharacterized protein with PIN domain